MSGEREVGGAERPAFGSHWLLPAAMTLGAALGLAWGALLGARWSDPALEWLVLGTRLLGETFLSLLKALAIPLVATSVISSVAQVGSGSRLGRLAAISGVWFAGSTLLAVATGLVLVLVFEPGAGVAATEFSELPARASAPASTAQAVYGVAREMFPSSWLEAALTSNVLGVLVASLLIGAGLARAGERARSLVDVVGAANHVLLDLVRLVVWLAPLGIFGLVADRIGQAGGGAQAWAELSALGGYALTVLAGLAFHALVSLPLLLLVLGRRRPYRYGLAMGDALLTAAGTASSAATLGVTLRCVTGAGVRERIADFVLPLGATVNMNGTALYEAIAVVFIAQVLGVELAGAELLVVLLTATLAAAGAAAIPEAGLVTMLLVLGAVGLPAEAAGLILSIDWILDRVRTAVNVWGDTIGAAIVDQRLGDELRS